MTLAGKHKSTVSKMAKRYKVMKETPEGPLKCLRVTVHRDEGKPPLIAEFGGIRLRQAEAVKTHDTRYTIHMSRTDLIDRVLAQRCEMCGRTATEKLRVVVHHIRKLKDLRREGRRVMPDWQKRMIALRRKTLVVCTECHWNIHMGQPCREPVEDVEP
jgi:hypothetical protein